MLNGIWLRGMSVGLNVITNKIRVNPNYLIFRDPSINLVNTEFLCFHALLTFLILSCTNLTKLNMVFITFLFT